MDSNLKPIISIITVTRDRASFISKAVESVAKQSFKRWELLVLDDDSKDTTEAIIRAFMATEGRIKYHKNSPALGISGNRNRALSLATGKYIAVLDSDDYWLDEDKLEKQYLFLEQNPEYALIGSNIKIVDEKDNVIKETNFAVEDGDIRKKIMTDNQVPHSTILMRKDMIERIGGYDEKLSCVEDLDLILKLGKLGKMKNLKEITTAYTRHTGNASHKQKIAMAWNHYKIVFKNSDKYPCWFTAIFWAKLRLIKSWF